MILVAILVLLLPGYLLARALRSPVSWPLAYPLSAMLLALTVIAYVLVGIPLRFWYVFASIFSVSLVCAVVSLRRRQEQAPPEVCAEYGNTSKLLATMVSISVALVLAGMLVRTSLYPLYGWDSAFRWDALPQLMLEQESLSHYPPVTDDDFTKYTYPEGIPPLAASVYWWLYAAWGEACPALTSVAVFLQAASCLGLVFYSARFLFGTTGALVATGTLISSTLFLSGVEMGQETGYTAISIAGQILFATLAGRQAKATLVIIAGVLAGMGALAREYGPALSLCGIVILLSQRATRRYVPLFCLVVILCGAPWYLRNWAITGNPLYSMDIGFGFPVNPVFAALLAKDHEVLGLHNFSAADWIHTAKYLIDGAALPLMFGIFGLVLSRRQGFGLWITTALVFLIWLGSVSYTSGGVEWSMRVLTPAWVSLAIAAAAVGRDFVDTNGWNKSASGIIAGALAIGGCYGAVAAWAYPGKASEIRVSIFSHRTDTIPRHVAALVDRLEATTLPACGVLTDDCYLAVGLARRTRFHPVMAWSPGVAFAFDPQLSAEEVRQRLIDKHVDLISIWNESPNIPYLSQFPLYREDIKNWRLIVNVSQLEAIYLLPAATKSAEEMKPKP